MSRGEYPLYITFSRLTTSLRDFIRAVMLDLHPEGFDKRFPGRNMKNLIVRKELNSVGPHREVSADGHEKIAFQGLMLGEIGLPIYGFKDKWEAYLLDLQVLPQIRKPGPIGHLYLDLIEKYGGEYYLFFSKKTA